MIEKFPCTSCGSCCKRIHNLKEYSEKLSIEKDMPELVFPYENNAGICEKFIDNKCSVYQDRPTICSIDRMYPILKFDKVAFYKMNANICNMFIREDSLDESFLINL